MSINILFKGREQCLNNCFKKKCIAIHQSIMPDHDFINILSHFINILKGLSFCNFEKGIDGGYYFQSDKKKMPSFSLLWLFE